MRVFPSFAAVALLAIAPCAQATHLVGGTGGLPDIGAALAIAAAGDVIVVQPGTYPHFAVSVGVTIRAATPGTVDVVFDPALVPAACWNNGYCAMLQGPTRFQLPPGATAHVVGLNFLPFTMWVNGPFNLVEISHWVHVVGGRVTCDACTFQADAAPALVATNGAAVHLQQCTLAVVAGPVLAALDASDANVTAVDCTVTGNGAGAALRLQSSVFHGTSVTLTGGTYPGGGGPAVQADAASALWIADATLRGGNGGGVCAVAGAANARIDRTVLLQPASCAGATAGHLLGVGRPQPLAAGMPFGLVFRTAPGGVVAVFASPGLATTPFAGVLAQPASLGLSGLIDAGTLIADAAGIASVSWAIPAVPALVDQTLWLQGLSGSTFPLELSPPVGGVVR